ncbi:hypothetical protein RM780_05990 [Streptomyces sp. DSM 44917]|uniref:Thiamine pyrophosphate enzyme TPP-binding domain-containing protein n=1 Tax=Streptomyces boetiae TaxID=3075541 RepID=A0ABU2L4P6_9ACTN|nr:hypothetical protein [Streptomyces sp. DSM 44917]MDT0306510.1 hypothetical protein [Streptomyces sp. DSM 44917]
MYAELLGRRGIHGDALKAVGAAWGEALAAGRPVVLEFRTDRGIAPIRPHIMAEQG